MDFQSTVAKIELLCKQKGVTPNKMLIDSGAGKNLLLNMRSGSSPNVSSLLQVAQYLEVSMDYLLADVGTPFDQNAPMDQLKIELELLASKLTAEQKQFLIAQMKVLLQEK